MHNKTVLVTGGAGFVGSHIVDRLIQEKFNVIIIDNLSTGKNENINQEAIFYNLDIVKDNLESLFNEYEIDYVLHFAAQASVNGSVNNPVNDADQNIIASINLFNLCDKYGIKKVIVASSAAVYGNPEYLPIDEKHPTNPLSFYGLSKLTMENYLKLFKTDYIIMRLSNVYGQRQIISGESGVITIFVDNIQSNKPVFIDGNGEQIRDFIFVKDVANIAVKLLKSDVKNETFNISTNSQCSINELFNILAKIYNYQKTPVYREKRTGDIEKSILNNSHLLSKINEISYEKLSKGLDSMRQVGLGV